MKKIPTFCRAQNFMTVSSQQATEHIQSQINSNHNLISYYFKSNCSMSLPSVLSAPTLSPSFTFPASTDYYKYSKIYYTFQMSRHLHNRYWSSQVANLLGNKQILTDCYLWEILERLQWGVFIQDNHKHTLLRLEFVITNTPAMNKHVTRVLIREDRRRHARLLAKYIRDLLHAAWIVTKWRSNA